MPEGPEIRQTADQLSDVLLNRHIQKVDLGLASLHPHQPQIQGTRVTAVQPHGKAMLISLASGFTIYSHNQLYGLWRVAKHNQLPATNRQLRLALHTSDHTAALYSASDISVWSNDKLYTHPFLAKLGPDILSRELVEADIVRRLQSPTFRNRRLGSLYLDQSFIAGIGNYLRSEILFFAGCHPDDKPSQLSETAIGRLAAASIQVARRSYLTKGYTVSKPLHQQAIEDKVPFEQGRFMVFDREAEPCRLCATKIIRLERNSRRLYLCPSCQPIAGK